MTLFSPQSISQFANLIADRSRRLALELHRTSPITSPRTVLNLVGKCPLVQDSIAEEAVQCQLDALKYNDQPHQDYGIEVMYQFAGSDPFERSTYFGPFFDLGQFERFRRIFHHSIYRVLLCHKEQNILSSLWVKENRFKQRVWMQGSRPEEEEIFQFTMVQTVFGPSKLYTWEDKLALLLCNLPSGGWSLCTQHLRLWGVSKEHVNAATSVFMNTEVCCSLTDPFLHITEH